MKECGKQCKTVHAKLSQEKKVRIKTVCNAYCELIRVVDFELLVDSMVKNSHVATKDEKRFSVQEKMIREYIPDIVKKTHEQIGIICKQCSNERTTMSVEALKLVHDQTMELFNQSFDNRNPTRFVLPVSVKKEFADTIKSRQSHKDSVDIKYSLKTIYSNPEQCEKQALKEGNV